MGRTPKIKELVETRLASTYGGWKYCNSCGKSILNAIQDIVRK